MEEIHATWLPEHPDFGVRREKYADGRLRSAILQRAGKQGAKFSRRARIGRGEANLGRPRVRRGWMLATAAAVLLAFAGGAAWQQYGARFFGAVEGKQAAVPTRALSPPAAAEPAGAEAPWHLVSGELQAALEKKVEEARREQMRLRRQLQAEQAKTAALEQSGADSAGLISELRRRLEASRDSEAATLAELERLKSLQAVTDGINIAQQQEIRKLTDRLGDQIASLDRERQLLAADREIRDLIAARNLHIIDVYDTDGRGHTSRAFGRVFYTEGRSLVFYAYDLNDRHGQSGKYVFSVWGKRDALPHDVKSLGALSQDGQAARWVLTVTDAKVLAEIDSVFVTIEPAGKPSKRPSGRRMLAAFLGSPANHP